MEDASTQIQVDNAYIKLRQLTAILSAVTGGNGIDHMATGEVQEVLNACYGMAVEALQSLR